MPGWEQIAVMCTVPWIVAPIVVIASDSIPWYKGPAMDSWYNKGQ
jgi:hypothetical protein